MTEMARYFEVIEQHYRGMTEWPSYFAGLLNARLARLLKTKI